MMFFAMFFSKHVLYSCRHAGGGITNAFGKAVELRTGWVSLHLGKLGIWKAFFLPVPQQKRGRIQLYAHSILRTTRPDTRGSGPLSTCWFGASLPFLTNLRALCLTQAVRV